MSRTIHDEKCDEGSAQMDDRYRKHFRRAHDLHSSLHLFSDAFSQCSGREPACGRHNLFPAVLVASSSCFRRHDVAVSLLSYENSSRAPNAAR